MVRKSKEGTLRFFARAGRLKSEPRRGWVVRFGIENPESVADHSYRTALMAMVYSDARGLDAEKAMKMALLHDLPEALVGDSIPGERAPTQKQRMESAAMRELLADLPSIIAKELWAVWQEFEEGASPEARLVRQLDKVEMAIQAHQYKRENPDYEVEEFHASAKKGVTDPDLVELIDGLF
jgi:putative hydrolases of HD superfamily